MKPEITVEVQRTMQLYLIRHPHPDVAAGICYGQSDLALAAPVAADAARLRALLPDRYALYTSPLQRARLLAEALGQPIVDARLQEISFGAWEGRSFEDIGVAIDDWVGDPLNFRAPGGESANEMATRSLQWLEEVQARPPAAAVVVVAHGGPLRAIAGHLLGLPPQRWLALDFGCGEASRLDVHDWGVLLRWFNR